MISCRKIASGALLCALFALFSSEGAWAQKSHDVRVPARDGRSYTSRLFVPDGQGPWPGVIVLHTFYGFLNGKAEVHDVNFGRRLAGEGYVVLVPDYAHPQFKHLPQHPALHADMAEIARWLSTRPETSGRALAAIGFSIGGTYGGRLASSLPSLKALIGYYGLYNPKTHAAVIAQAKGRPLPPGPVDFAGKVNAAVLLLHGADDNETKIDQATDYKRALEQAGKNVELVVYPGAYHRFDRGPAAGTNREKTPEGYVYRLDPKARDDAWTRTLRFLETNLK